MPYKDKEAYNRYLREYMRRKRNVKPVKPTLLNPVKPDVKPRSKDIQARLEAVGIQLEGNRITGLTKQEPAPISVSPKLYDPHKRYGPGDRVLVARGTRLYEVIVPELDADGNIMPDWYLPSSLS